VEGLIGSKESQLFWVGGGVEIDGQQICRGKVQAASLKLNVYFKREFNKANRYLEETLLLRV
jgi:hypothetical protein